MTSTNEKIIIVSQLGISNAGGVERVSYYLKEILERNSYNVELLTRGKFNFRMLSNLLWPLILSFRLHFIKHTLVIGNSYHCFLYPADLSIHHGTMRGVLNHCKAGRAGAIIAWMEKISAIKAKKILAVSWNCQKELIEYYKINPDKIEVFNNFVDENIFFPPKSATVTNDNSAKETIAVLFSGALTERKGLKKLIEFSDYIESHDLPYNIELRLASNSKEAFHFFQNRKNTKIISGMGISEMPDFYRNGSLLIFPTLYEGFSMATLEALASGLPVLGTDFAVTKELENFDFCKMDDFSDIAKSVENCISLYEKYSSKKEEIAAAIIKDFGKAAYEKKLLAFVEEAMSRAKKGSR